jgi:L-Ala-D/L-Glu epimerase
MSLKTIEIEAVEIYQSKIKLKEPFILSLGPLHYSENIIISIRTGNNLRGFGECSPFKTINGESMETAFVVARYLAKALLGKNPLDPVGCSDIMDRVIYGNSSIKSAFDMAIHDIASGYFQMPLFEWLGGKKTKKIITDYTVSLGEPEKMALDALKIKQQGFKVIKVKLGDSSDGDIERIRKIRESIGNEIPLRLDANQGWNAASSVNVLQSLYPYNIQFCEEPIPRWDYMNLPALKNASPIPLMADESCCDHHDARRLIDLGACSYFNLKLGKSSGISGAMKIIRLAEQANMPMQVGGFLESRLGFTASAHLAMASNLVTFFDFDTPLMLETDPVGGGISYHPGGEITLPEGPGLGAWIEDDYLKNLPWEVIT